MNKKSKKVISTIGTLAIVAIASTTTVAMVVSAKKTALMHKYSWVLNNGKRLNLAKQTIYKMGANHYTTNPKMADGYVASLAAKKELVPKSSQVQDFKEVTNKKMLKAMISIMIDGSIDGKDMGEIKMKTDTIGDKLGKTITQSYWNLLMLEIRQDLDEQKIETENLNDSAKLKIKNILFKQLKTYEVFKLISKTLYDKVNPDNSWEKLSDEFKNKSLVIKKNYFINILWSIILITTIKKRDILNYL